MPQLRFFDAGRELFSHPVRGGRTVIGRSDSCDLSLPSDTVSRVHCLIDRRAEGWVLQNRSRHGTYINGLRVDDHAALEEGDEVTVGAYRARFTHQDTVATETVPVVLALHEELVEAGDEQIVTCRAEVRFVRGPLTATTQYLNRAVATLGGPGSTIELDDKLPRAAVTLRVVRGRAMVEPGSVPTHLAGLLVTELTPAFPGEEVRVGEHGFVITPAIVVEQTPEIASFGEMVAVSPAMLRLFGALRQMASHDAPVLLIGESGTGKELAARGIHECGSRFEKPFVPLNCAAIAPTLFESELFGYEKGAFTGAASRTDGAFHRANGGTLFLDEIGELPLELQSKLLRALEAGEVRRIGATTPEYPNVRLVCATNRRLPEMVRKGTFRSDLYFRIAVLTGRIPSLRERIEDIPIVVDALLRRHHVAAMITPEAIGALQEYAWPGNVRELRNVLTRAVVMFGEVIGPGSLSFQPWSFEDDGLESIPSEGALPKRGAILEEAERARLAAALSETEGNRTKAARLLEMPRATLLFKINKYGL